MTREEIKAAYSMRDILARYGMEPSRAGFVSCPFHSGDREASMKIYPKDFNCFGCGANGDIFEFVMLMEDCSFSEAFKLLGGEYEQSFRAYQRVQRFRQRKQAEDLRRRAHNQKIQHCLALVTAYQTLIRQADPLSDLWCYCTNALQYQLHYLDHLTAKEGKNWS